jgi:hypothetical protein
MAPATIEHQTERTIYLAASGVMVQETMLAAKIEPFQYVVPYVRVVRSADNNLKTTGVNFTFITAAFLATTDDESAKGARFVEVSGYTVAVMPPADIIGAGVNGQTFTATPANGVIPALQNMGGLLLWKCTNPSAINAATLRFEIHLICR